MTNFKMPKSCISCGCYEHKGFAKDEHSPFRGWSGEAKHGGRVQFGVCSQHGTDVFATEICNTYESIPGVQILEVMNRPEPKEVRQERLF